MTNLFGRGLASIILINATILAFLIAVFLIAVQLVGPKPVIDAISCELSLSHECLRNDLRKERRKLDLERQKRQLEEKKRSALEERVAELKRIEKRAKELEALYQRLAKLDHAASSYVVFHTSSFRRYKVETGHKYASLLDPNTLIEGWCSIVLNGGAIARFFTIAGFEKNRRVVNQTVGRTTLREAGLSGRDVSSARKYCKWPRGVS